MNHNRAWRNSNGSSYSKVVKKLCLEHQSTESKEVGSDSFGERCFNLDNGKDSMEMDEGTFQFHEKCGNLRKDQFIPSCLLERLEGRNVVQSSLNNQLSFEKVTGASMINQLCLASERGFGMGSSGLGPLDKPHVACPKPKRVHFKDGRLPAKIVGLNRPVSPILNGNLELVRNKAFCDDRVGANDESDDSSKEQSLADPPLQVPKFGADVGLEQAMSRNIVINLSG
ncbi:hypothetical protein QYF36_023079 [Acer negundo]|nr:hypothetical protein QYF36_023079 [Acer negundo]